VRAEIVRLGLTVVDSGMYFRGNILIQRSAESHIYKLSAAADAEDGFICFKYLVKGAKIEIISWFYYITAGLLFFFAVPRGIDVRASCEAEPVAKSYEIIKNAFGLTVGKNDRRSARFFNRADVVVYGGRVFSFVHRWENADYF